MNISLCIHGVYMAKLYWRVKRDGKWTWKPATMVYSMAATSPDGVDYWCVACSDYTESQHRQVSEHAIWKVQVNLEEEE